MSLFATRIGPEIARRLPAGAAAALGGDPSRLRRDPAAIAALPDPVEAAVRSATAASIHLVFLVTVGAAALGLLAAFRLVELPLRTGGAEAGEPQPDEARGEGEGTGDGEDGAHAVLPAGAMNPDDSRPGPESQAAPVAQPGA
jgi:hypothetical protein